MPIDQTPTLAALERSLSQSLQRRKLWLARQLTYIGEQAVNEARSKGNYTDRTGALRASLGYCVLLDGQRYAYSSQRPVATQGKALELVVSAGQHYAPYVAARGYDVLDSAELKAETAVAKLKGLKRL